MKTRFNKPWQITMLLLLTFSIAIPACLKQGQGTNTGNIVIRDGQEDPYDEIEGVQFEDGKEIRRTKDKAKSDVQLRVPKEPKEEKPKSYDHLGKSKLHPLVERWLKEKQAGDMVEIMIRFQDSFSIPRFPELNPLENRNSAYNQAAIKRSTALGDELKKRRSKDQAVVLRTLKQFDAKVTETFWIINSVVASVSVGSIKSIIEMRQVLYIDPVQSEDKPPQNANNNDDVQDGRGRINSDPYFNLGQRNGFIGLLDSGVDTDHELFTTPNQVDLMFDCVEGGNNCDDTGDPDFNPNDDCWDHGTSSAAIMTANNDRGNDHRGVTAITVDNLKVYPSGCVGLNTTAAVRGFERAIEIGDRVIVAEMQGGGDHKSSIAEAADNAFEAGAVIIAANGNNGPGGSTVNCPANAHKVMGIGNYDVQTLAAIPGQSRGPSADDRFKPDFRCPTNSETADSGGFSSYSGFGGTSGATPYAGAAAALVRNFMRGNTGSIDPGKVYAFLINSAQDPYPFNNDIGAGDLVLPVNGHAWWGKTTITDGANRDITINITDPNYRTLDMAIWWPEENFEWTGIIPRWDHHDDVDLRMINPSGSTVSSSVSVPSVFERVRTTGAIATGNWRIRIHGFDVTGTQTVYWCVTGTR